MGTNKNIALALDLVDQVDGPAQVEGRIPDDVANEAIHRELTRRGLQAFVDRRRETGERYVGDGRSVRAWRAARRGEDGSLGGLGGPRGLGRRSSERLGCGLSYGSCGAAVPFGDGQLGGNRACAVGTAKRVT